MAQNAPLGKSKKASSSSSKPHDPKKGRRTIAPKKSNLVKGAGITKKYSSGMTAKTERGLAQKVGHLELLEGGKGRAKDKGKGGDEKKKGGGGGVGKGKGGK